MGKRDLTETLADASSASKREKHDKHKEKEKKKEKKDKDKKKEEKKSKKSSSSSDTASSSSNNTAAAAAAAAGAAAGAAAAAAAASSTEASSKKSSKKSKSSASASAAALPVFGENYEQKVKQVVKIAVPLASKKLAYDTLHAVQKIAKTKNAVRRGVKEVGKALRKGELGLVVLAGDISPIDVISHLPVTCEERRIPYVYVPSKSDLGAACCTKRPTSVVLVNLAVVGSANHDINNVISEVRKLQPHQKQ